MSPPNLFPILFLGGNADRTCCHLEKTSPACLNAQSPRSTVSTPRSPPPPPTQAETSPPQAGFSTRQRTRKSELPYYKLASSPLFLSCKRQNSSLERLTFVLRCKVKDKDNDNDRELPATMISMIMILNQKGDVMISRQYRYVMVCHYWGWKSWCIHALDTDNQKLFLFFSS